MPENIDQQRLVQSQHSSRLLRRRRESALRTTVSRPLVRRPSAIRDPSLILYFEELILGGEHDCYSERGERCETLESGLSVVIGFQERQSRAHVSHGLLTQDFLGATGHHPPT